MPNWLYETTGNNGLWVFLLFTVVLGGAAAWATGRAISGTWRPFWQVPIYACLLTLAVRFLHFALFGEPLLAPGNVVIDYAVLVAFALAGHRLERMRAMTTQYDWLYQPSGKLGWVTRTGSNPSMPRDLG